MIKIIGNNGYIDMSQVLSCHPVVAYIRTGRGLGKTTWAAATSIKHCRRNAGEFLIYVRTTKEQMAKAKATWFKSSILKMTNTNPDDVKIDGDFGYIKVCGTWQKCVRFVRLSNKRAERSADDPKAWLIVYDEGDVTASERWRYRGDLADDLADLHDSLRRETGLPMVIFSNKESASNQILNYHGIKNPPDDWQGCRRYKRKTFIFISTDACGPDISANATAFKDTYGSTKYGKFRYQGAAHSGATAPIASKSRNATRYAMFHFTGIAPLTVWRDDQQFIVTQGVDKSQPQLIIVDKPDVRYQGARVFKPNDIRNFMPALIKAHKRSAVYADNAATAEEWETLCKRIGL